MDVKTLSAMLGHVSAATTLDIYTHVTGDMQTEAAAKIDRGLGNEGAGGIRSGRSGSDRRLQPVLRKTRKPGTGCITQINDHLFEGRYSPTCRTAPNTPNASTPTPGRNAEAKLKC